VWASGALAAILLAGAAFLLLPRLAEPGASPPANSIAAKSDALPVAAISPASIAVLPFADLSPAGDQAYFSDGIAEEILNVLAQIDGLTVASRTSAFALRDGKQGAPAIAATLNVRYLLEGSVRRDGEKLRITAQLIDALSDRHLWSKTYDREIKGIFAIQEEIAAAIAVALRDKVGVTARRVESRRTDNLAAYDKYLKARGRLRNRGDGLREAIALFREVVAEDPSYAPGWSGLAQALEPAIFYFPEVKDPFVFAQFNGMHEFAAARALELAPDGAEALGSMANVHRVRGEWAQAEDLYRRALARDPNEPEVIEDFQEFLHRVGRDEEALEGLPLAGAGAWPP
jgi:TolB-like protein